MELTILGSGGCTVIPKPLCRCRICKEARVRGIPYERTGPSIFIHDINLLVDTPAETARQLNRSRIRKIEYLTFTHLDPDHVEGFRVVEQIALDFRSWRAHKDKQIRLILPETLSDRISNIRSVYGPLIDFYEDGGFVESISFRETINIGDVKITAIPVDRGSQIVFVYVFEKGNKKIVYAPCDLKPFPLERKEVQTADLLVIQPGIFEDGLRYGFTYPKDHISRTTLYTFEETLALASTLQSRNILFVHLEEYWNRGHDEYLSIEKSFDNISFAYDGMHIKI